MGRARKFLLALSIAAAALGCGDRDEASPKPSAAPSAPPAIPAPASAATAPDEPQAEPEAAPSPEDAEALRAAEALAAKLGLPHPVVTLEVESYGSIRIELLPEKAPKTAANFAGLAEKGFYDGTTFHRIIPGFMIQGGDPNSKNRDPRDDGLGGPDYTIPDEPSDLKHVRGVVSMANLGRPQTGGSQFFILVADRPDLDGHYSAFGRVVDGMDVADKIASVETDLFGRYGPPDRPRTNVVVSRARSEEEPAPAAKPTPSPRKRAAAPMAP